MLSGIPESAEEEAEVTTKTFTETHLKLPWDTVKNITFHWVHHLRARRLDARIFWPNSNISRCRWKEKNKL